MTGVPARRPVPPVAGLACPRHAAGNHGAHRWADRRCCPPAVYDVGAGCDRGLEHCRARFPPEHLADHWPSRQLTRAAVRYPEDQTEGSARVLLVGASVASLLGAGYALHLAGQESGPRRVLLIGAAVLTVVLSWAVINTVYALRYADQHFRSKAGGIAFGTEDGQPASRLPRLRLSRLHYRHDLPGVRHRAVRPPDPAHGTSPRRPVLCVRRGHRRRFGQPHLWAAPLTRPGPAGRCPEDW